MTTHATSNKDAPRVHIVAGKGGVGKTSVAAALAINLIKRGHKVLLAEANGGDQIAALLGAPPTKGSLQAIRNNLTVVDLQPQACIREYAVMTLHIQSVVRAVLDSRAVRRLLDMIPSLGELTMLGKLWFHEQERDPNNDARPRFDHIVLDAPATGHAISMLRAPQVVAQAVPKGPLRANCVLIDELLRNGDKTRLHIVMTPEEMPVNEAVMLEQAANDVLGIKLGPAIINQSMTPLPNDIMQRLEQCQGAHHDSVFSALRKRNVRAQAGVKQIGRLPAHLHAEAICLPRIVLDTWDGVAIENLAMGLEMAIP